MDHYPYYPGPWHEMSWYSREPSDIQSDWLAQMASAEVPWMTRVPLDAWQTTQRLYEAQLAWQRQQAEQDKARSQLARNGEDTW